MAKFTIGGVTIHPLFNLPLAALTLAGVSDFIALLSGQRSWSRTAYHLQLFGILGGLAGGVPAMLDYQSVPVDTEKKDAATIHAVLNAGLLGWALLNVLIRRANPEGPGILSQAMSILSVPLWLYSAFQGRLIGDDGMAGAD